MLTIKQTDKLSMGVVNTNDGGFEVKVAPRTIRTWDELLEWQLKVRSSEILSVGNK